MAEISRIEIILWIGDIWKIEKILISNENCGNINLDIFLDEYVKMAFVKRTVPVWHTIEKQMDKLEDRGEWDD